MYHRYRLEILIHKIKDVSKHFLSDNIFPYNAWFLSNEPLKKVPVGSGRAGPDRLTSKMDFLSENEYFLVIHHMSTINIDRAMALRKIRCMSPEKSATSSNQLNSLIKVK